MTLNEQVKQILTEGAEITTENVTALTEMFTKALTEQKVKLTEDFNQEKEKMDAAAKQAIQEAFESGQERVEDLVEMQVEALLQEHAEKFVKDDTFNKMTAAFDEIKSTFEKHGFVLNESAALDEANQKLVESDNAYKTLFEKYEHLKEENQVLRNDLELSEQTLLMIEKTEGLAETTKEKVRKLAESITVENMDEFKQALDLIVEQAKEKEGKDDNQDKDTDDDNDNDDKKDADKKEGDMDESKLPASMKVKHQSLAYMDADERAAYWKTAFAG